MKISLNRISEPYQFEARNESGNTVSIDAGASIGGGGNGARPMELLIMGLGGCSGIDIVTILNKQKQKIDSFQIEIDAERETGKPANLFQEIHIRFILEGSIEKDKLEHAISLSMDKYCSVAKTLEKTAKITHSYVLNGEK
ncbi:MAG: OsmC family protein [Leptospiraceae bacterium]|nr:OsmC family protein [Leptospiraceae bacterium]MCP5512764.1 OsmC family protein [Leptospiraceae bacterium]